jgi:hypothetical protein
MNNTRLGFEVFTAVAINNVVFWDVMSCGSTKNRRFGGKYRLHHHQGDKNRRVFLRNVFRFLVIVNIAVSSPILVTPMIGAMRSSETAVLTRATWR